MTTGPCQLLTPLTLAPTGSDESGGYGGEEQERSDY